MSTLSFNIRNKIFKYCILDNESMIKVANLLGIRVELVREYISFYISHPEEQEKMLPASKKGLVKQPTMSDKFTGYFTEMTEEDIRKINEPKEYRIQEVISERETIFNDKRSFPERLEDKINYLKKLTNG